MSSKIKKKPLDRAATGVSKLDITFEKIIQFAGWIFLLASGAFLGYWVVLDVILNKIEVILNPMTYAFVIFTGISAALCFGLMTRIQKNRDQKKKIFENFLVGEFIFCMLSIFAVGVYVW